MPMIEKTQRIRVTKDVGFRCDRCNQDFELPNNEPVKLHHNFGYFSNHDCTTVQCVVCENCLFNLISEHIPGAVFKTYTP